MRRTLVLVGLLLSLLDGLDHPSSAQSNQDRRVNGVSDTEWKQVTSVSLTNANRYHSEYFDFTYSLPDGFVDETEQFKSRIRTLPGSPPDPDRFVLLHAEKRQGKSADPFGEITVTVDALSRYPERPTEKDFMHTTASSMLFAGDDVLREGKQVEISGWNFFRADYKMKRPKSGYLIVMVAFRKDFALLWQFSAHSQKEVGSITSSMPRKLNTK